MGLHRTCRGAAALLLTVGAVVVPAAPAAAAGPTDGGTGPAPTGPRVAVHLLLGFAFVLAGAILLWRNRRRASVR